MTDDKTLEAAQALADQLEQQLLPKGERGPRGPKGDKGDKGDDGLSAYEVAVENGFVGTEQQWLESLKGRDGVGGVIIRETAAPVVAFGYFPGGWA